MARVKTAIVKVTPKELDALTIAKNESLSKPEPDAGDYAHVANWAHGTLNLSPKEIVDIWVSDGGDCVTRARLIDFVFRLHEAAKARQKLGDNLQIVADPESNIEDATLAADLDEMRREAVEPICSYASTKPAPDKDDVDNLVNWLALVVGDTKRSRKLVVDKLVKLGAANTIDDTVTLTDYYTWDVHKQVALAIEEAAGVASDAEGLKQKLSVEQTAAGFTDAPVSSPEAAPCPVEAPEVCPEAEYHTEDSPCFSCGKGLEPASPPAPVAPGLDAAQEAETAKAQDSASSCPAPAVTAFTVNEDGEVLDLPGVFKFLGWTEYPTLPENPSREQIAAHRAKVDQVADIVASCREQAARYKEQAERRARAKEARAASYETLIAPAAVQLAEALLPRYQSGAKAGQLKKKFVDLDSARLTFKSSGGWTHDREQVQRIIDHLDAGVLNSASLPAKAVRSIDWPRLKALVKKHDNKIPLKDSEQYLTIGGFEYSTPNPLATLVIKPCGGSGESAHAEEEE